VAGAVVRSLKLTITQHYPDGLPEGPGPGSVPWHYHPHPLPHCHLGEGRDPLGLAWYCRNLYDHQPPVADTSLKPPQRRCTDTIDARATLPLVPGTVTRLPVSERQRQRCLCRQLAWLHPVGQPFADGTPVARAPPCLAASPASAGQEGFRILEGNGTHPLLRA
jgi:hypothetical protein